MRIAPIALGVSVSALLASGCRLDRTGSAAEHRAAEIAPEAVEEPAAEPADAPGAVAPAPDGTLSIQRSPCWSAGCELVFTFSHDMVAAGAKNLAAAKPVEVVFEPAQRGTFAWRSPRKLVFAPAKKSLQWGHDVKVTIPAATPLDGPGSALGKPWVDEFRVPYFEAAGKVARWPIIPGRPRLVDFLNAREGQIGKGPIYLLYDQPVRPALVAEHLRASNRRRALRVKVTRPASLEEIYSGDLDERLVVAVRVVELPADGESVALQYPSTLEQKGVPEIATTSFAARTSFSFLGGEFAGESLAPSTRVALDQTLVLRFDNPVSERALGKALSIEPEVEEMRVSWIWGTEANVFAKLEPGTDYRLKIAKNLRDKLGNKLGKTGVVRFRSHDLAPELELPQTALTLERGHSKVPVRATNVGDIAAHLHSFAATKDFLAALSQGAGFRCAAADAKADWKVSAPAKRNREVERSLALEAEPTAGFACLELSATGTGSRAEAEPLSAHVLLQVTGLGVTTKVEESGLLVWVTHLRDATPVQGARVTLLGSDGAVRKRASTDADGLAHLADTDLTGRGGLSGVGFVVAETAGDRAIARISGDQVSQPWQYGLRGDVRDVEEMAAAVFTDRGVYRPDETVHVKIAARDPKNGLMPSRGRVEVSVSDPRGREVLQKSFELDAYGATDLDVPLSPSAAVGRYSLHVTHGDRVSSRTFQVEEYRVPTFEVKVTSSAPWASGKKAQVNISADYLHGGELAARRVEYTVSRDRAWFRPTGFSGYRFRRADVPAPAGTIAHKETRLDGQGRLAIAFPTRHASAAGPMRYVVDASVTDVDRQVYKGRLARVVHPTDYYLGVRPPSRAVFETGEKLEVPIVAVAPSGAAVAGVRARVRLERIDYHTTARLAGTHVQLDNRPVAEKVGECSVTLSRHIASCRFSLENAGRYRVVAVSRDSSRRRVETGFELNVAGSSTAAWPRFEHERIDLIADKPAYRPGETAKLIVQSPFRRARGLLTLERGNVIEHRQFEIADDTPVIEVPLTEAHAPNVYASVVLLRGRVHDRKDATGFETGAPAFRMGVTELRVRPLAHELAVAVTPSAPRAHPKQEVTVDLNVRDRQGEPTSGQATVMVVDEAVLGLTGYRTPDPIAQILAPRPLGVRTAANQLDLPNSRRARREQIFPGGDGGSGFGVSELSPELRNLFESTAYWNPRVPVGADGKARVTFTLPDNVTTYRVMAVVLDKGTRAGSGSASLLVRKPLMVQPALPRFLHPGDELRLEARAFNGTERTGRVRMSVVALGMSVSGPAVERRAVPAGGSTTFAFPARVVGRDRVTLRFAAQLDDHSDVVEVELPVLDPGSERRIVEKHQVSGSDELEVVLPKNRVPGSAELEVMVSSTRLGQLKESVDYLMGYPNGCIEQTTSRAYPLIVLEDLLPDMGVTVDEAKLKEYSTAGVKRLLSFQTTSGGLAYWPGSDDPHAFGTAFGLTALLEAKARGYEVPDEALRRMGDYLEAQLRSGRISEEMPHESMADADTRALFVMTLGRMGRPQPGYAARLWREHDKLTAFGLSFLAVAVAEMPGGDKSLLDPVLAAIRKKAEEEKQEAYYKGNPDGGWSMGSPLRTHAGALLAYARTRPADEMTRKLLTGLLNRQHSGQWGNTQENVFGIMAVARAVDRASTSEPEISLTLNGDAAGLGAAEKVSGSVLRYRVGETGLRLASGKPSPQRVGVRNRSSGPAYVTMRATYAVKLDADGRKPQVSGFEVKRSYRSLAGSKLDPKSIPLGSLVRVVLSVETTNKQNYVAVSDRLPAGLEPLNANLATTQTVTKRGLSAAAKRGLGVLSYSEVRDSRVAFYADELPAGRYEFEYLARATSAGTFLRPAAAAEAMYQPDSFGTSAIDTVSVR